MLRSAISVPSLDGNWIITGDRHVIENRGRTMHRGQRYHLEQQNISHKDRWNSHVRRERSADPLRSPRLLNEVVYVTGGNVRHRSTSRSHSRPRSVDRSYMTVDVLQPIQDHLHRKMIRHQNNGYYSSTLPNSRQRINSPQITATHGTYKKHTGRGGIQHSDFYQSHQNISKINGTVAQSFSRKKVVLNKSAHGGLGFTLLQVSLPNHNNPDKFKPSSTVPALQYIGEVIPGGSAYLAGLKPGDFILEINGINVTSTLHQRVVQTIKNSRNKLELTVMSVAGRSADTHVQTLSHRHNKNAGNRAGRSKSRTKSADRNQAVVCVVDESKDLDDMSSSNNTLSFNNLKNSRKNINDPSADAVGSIHNDGVTSNIELRSMITKIRLSVDQGNDHITHANTNGSKMTSSKLQNVKEINSSGSGNRNFTKEHKPSATPEIAVVVPFRTKERGRNYEDDIRRKKMNRMNKFAPNPVGMKRYEEMQASTSFSRHDILNAWSSDSDNLAIDVHPQPVIKSSDAIDEPKLTNVDNQNSNIDPITASSSFTLADKKEANEMKVIQSDASGAAGSESSANDKTDAASGLDFLALAEQARLKYLNAKSKLGTL